MNPYAGYTVNNFSLYSIPNSFGVYKLTASSLGLNKPLLVNILN